MPAGAVTATEGAGAAPAPSMVTAPSASGCGSSSVHVPAAGARTATVSRVSDDRPGTISTEPLPESALVYDTPRGPVTRNAGMVAAAFCHAADSTIGPLSAGTLNDRDTPACADTAPADGGTSARGEALSSSAVPSKLYLAPNR